MNRDLLIRKAVAKLSQKKITGGDLSEFVNSIQKTLKRIKHDDLEAPKQFLIYFGNTVKSENLQKEEIQEILSKAKTLGIIKKSIKSNKYMERAWRAILKNYRLQGFLLEN